MSAESLLQSTIDAAWAAANSTITSSQAYSDSAVTAAAGYISPAVPHIINAPTVPTLGSAPTGVDGTFNAEYDASMVELQALLDSRLSDFLADFYPDYTAKLATISDWINNTIQNGGTGLPAAVEAAIWDRARAREDRTAVRSESELFTTFASKGFPIPPGAQQMLVKEIQQANQKSANALSRDIAIKQAEFELENIRFAISTGANLHMAVMSAASNYMNTIINVASTSNAKAGTLVQAITTLHNLTLSYYQAEMAGEELTFRYDTTKASSDLKLSDIEVRAYSEGTANKVGAAMAGAEQMGKIAAAAIGSQNSMASISNNTEA